jgi:alcohol dehydrogenase class IV
MSVINLENVHTFYSPTKVVFGKGTARTVAQEVNLLGGKKVLVVTDPGVEKTDLLKPVEESLNAAGIPFSIFNGVKPEPPSWVVDEGAKKCRSEGCDFVVGVGGGSSLDCAKGIAIMATNEGSIMDFCGVELVKNRRLPTVLISTTSGTGSEVTRALVITDEKAVRKNAVVSFYVLADVAIVDPLLTLSMPPKVTAHSGVDALTHGLESYVSVMATFFSEPLAERAIRWISRYLPVAWAKGSNMEARYFMSLSSTMAGMAFASSGLGAVHALGHTLGVEYHLAHGAAMAAVLPAVMQYNISGNPEKFARIASFMGKEVDGLSTMEAAQEAVTAVQELLVTIQVPSRLRDYGIPKDDIPKLAKAAMRESRLLTFNPRDMQEDDVRSLLEEAY